MNINVAIEYEVKVPDGLTEEQIEEFVRNFVIEKAGRKAVEEYDVDYAWRDVNDDSCVLYGSCH